jgi:protein gp37
MTTKIEWVKSQDGSQGKTWNPTVGCSRVSSGCKNCFAERMARRLQAMGREEYQGTVNGNGRWTGVVNLVPERLEEPLKRKKPTTWFVDSMSDLFHESISLEWQTDIFEVMTKASWHTFQVLTKRPDVMLARWNDIGTGVAHRLGKQREPGFWPPFNIWGGISAEDQKAADERIPLLLRTQLAVRFVSAEPLLGPVFLRPSWFRNDPPQFSQRQVFLGGIDWLIAGGESGPNARPCHPDWVRQLRDQCQAAGVAFFLKQRGEYLTLPEAMEAGIKLSIADALNANSVGLGNGFVRVGKKAAGRLLDGVQWNEMPWREEFPR